MIPARCAVAGPIAINPVSAELKLDLKDFGLVPLQPYFTDRVNILISSADLSVTGTTSLAVPPAGTPNVSFNGEVTLTNFASVDKAKSEDFLKWNTLFAGGIAYQHNPMQLSIDQLALSDFYSRIIIYPRGPAEPAEHHDQAQEASAANQAPPAPNETASRSSGRDGPPPVVAPAAPTTPAPPQPRRRPRQHRPFASAR